MTKATESFIREGVARFGSVEAFGNALLTWTRETGDLTLLAAVTEGMTR